MDETIDPPTTTNQLIVRDHSIMLMLTSQESQDADEWAEEKGAPLMTLLHHLLMDAVAT